MLMPDDIDLQAEPDVCPCCNGVVGGCTECSHRRTRTAFDQRQALEDDPPPLPSPAIPRPSNQLARGWRLRGGR
jgi:hypothetical protein